MKYSSYSFSCPALDGVGEASRPGRALPRERPPVLIVQDAGWAPDLVWTQTLEEKSFRLCRGWNLDRLLKDTYLYEISASCRLVTALTIVVYGLLYMSVGSAGNVGRRS
jgi:hypothetical protein